MGFVEAHKQAPRVVTRFGYYFIGLAALKGSLLFVASLDGGVSPWLMLPIPIWAATGAGLVAEQRWAYVTAIALSGLSLAVTFGVVVYVSIQPSHMALIAGLGLGLMSFLVAAPPLLMLSGPARAWFHRRGIAVTS